MIKLRILFCWVALLMISAACQTAKAPNTGVSIGVSELTIADIHRAFQSGEYTSEQLVQAYLDRIKKVNPQIHALSFINPEALMEARKLDEEYRKTKVLRPLHGIPIIVKDNINTAGLPTTGGSLALENFIPAEDAFIIKKLREAGAIVIAKSNMAEWAFSPRHSISSTYGETLNPYNTEYVPAGSSGGTGASVAASLGTIGLGTDTGNSIRGPSSHNALVGFRTTIGLVSRADIIPLYLRNDVVGAMCRTVEDATLVLEAMTGYDPTDPVTKYSEGKIPANYTQYLQRNGLKGARIGVLRELSEVDPDPEVKALFEKSIRDMESLGAVMVDAVTVPDFAELRKNQWCADFRADLETYLATYVKNDTIKTLEDIIRIGSTSKLTNDRVAYSAEHSGRAANPEITCADPYTDQRRIAFRKAIEDEMDRLKLDAIIYPTWNNKPAKTSRFNEDYKGDNSQIISPHTGQPAFTVPMGFTTGNLPAGVQFLGRMYAEPTLIKLVYSYEQGTKHRKPPVVTK